MQMKGRGLHVDVLGSLPTRLGAQRSAVPQRFQLKWHPSFATPCSWVSILEDCPRLYLYPYPFILLLPASQPPASEYPPLLALRTVFLSRRKPRDLQQPAPAAPSRLAALAAASSTFPLSQGRATTTPLFALGFPGSLFPPPEPPPPPWPASGHAGVYRVYRAEPSQPEQ